ncbi:MAG TPA: hypothetical protein ENN98_05040 [Desulfurivibrio alkaliphilus]|uniref:DoxX family membrane protein n=1 Tax=Desulfurivibrio alkaliphilus TaxID=427923 RepID=A0A7C2THQ8_9BACT|nr:hypothetical protein [Desulfurivibrio alkaliphilus]
MPHKESWIPKWLDRFDACASAWLDKHCQVVLRLSLAIIFFWFGALKPLGLSPEEELIKSTVYWVEPSAFIPILGWWEMAIGLGLLCRPLIRVALLLLVLQIPGTMLPLLLLPEVCFTRFPFGVSLEGQYIIKNLFLVSAAFVIGGKVRQSSR